MKRLRDSKSGGGRSRGEGRGAGGSSGDKPFHRRRKNRTPTRPIRVLGVVGGIGSGKSLVAKRLAELGATVIDADAVGHALLDQGPVQETLVRHFGTDILSPPDDEGQRHVDRRALGSIVFADEQARKVLEAAVHPRMRTAFERVISRLGRQVSPKPGALRLPPPVVVLDAAVLYEAGWNDLCDLVAFVDAPRKDRIKRLKEQRDWSPDELDRREAAQWPLDLKKNQAQVILKNPDSDDKAQIHKEIDKLWDRLNANSRPAPQPKTGAPDYSHLIEDEIEVLAPERPKPRRNSGPKQPRSPGGRSGGKPPGPK
jgi:dephospho-CoA kinase